MASTCPICNKDDAIQKLSVIVDAGKSSGTFSGPSGGVAYVGGKWGTVGGYSILSGSTMSELASRLAPPIVPQKKKLNSTTGVAVALGMIIGAFLVFLLVASSSDNLPVALVIAVISFILMVWIETRYEKNIRKEGEETYLKEKPIWDTAIDKWSRLYFCHRDGIVFDPNTNETCQPDQLNRFIYS